MFLRLETMQCLADRYMALVTQPEIDDAIEVLGHDGLIQCIVAHGGEEDFASNEQQRTARKGNSSKCRDISR